MTKEQLFETKSQLDTLAISGKVLLKVSTLNGTFDQFLYEDIAITGTSLVIFNCTSRTGKNAVILVELDDLDAVSGANI